MCNEHQVPPTECFRIHHPEAYNPNSDGPIEVAEPPEQPIAVVDESVVTRVQSIKVFHNVEMAHRLSMQPNSKCYNVHGHTWNVDLELTGPVDRQGMVLGLEFGVVKKVWRNYLDETFDHHFLVNYDDPVKRSNLAGVVLMPMRFGDPTVENVAKLWGMQAKAFWPDAFVSIHLGEAAHNAATWKG